MNAVSHIVAMANASIEKADLMTIAGSFRATQDPTTTVHIFDNFPDYLNRLLSSGGNLF